MRQSDGTELLGPNDPRSTTIGIIYVAPNDDRKSVLEGIYTQERLQRKRVVIVLPEQNKAFQRSIDFDGLKDTRKKLNIEIIFIAPSGPGPAELARQRRFPVFSTLDGYVKSLQDEAQGQAAEEKRGFFGFGGKPKQQPTPSVKPVPPPPALPPLPPVPVPQAKTQPLPPSLSAPSAPPAPLLPPSSPVQLSQPSPPAAQSANVPNGQQATQKTNAVALGTAAGMASLAAGLEIASLSGGDKGMPVAPPLSAPDGEEDDLPPIPPRAGTPVVDSSLASSNPVSNASTVQPDISPRPIGPMSLEERDRSGPIPIELARNKGDSGKLPATGRTTQRGGNGGSGKLPIPPPSADPHAPPLVVPTPIRQRNGQSGKLPIVGAGAVAAAGATHVVSTIPPRSGGLPPTRSNMGGGRGSRGGGAGGPRRRGPLGWLLIVALVLLTLLVAFVAIAYAAPQVLGPFTAFVPGAGGSGPPPSATITITPSSQDVKDTFVITGVTGTPSPNPDQRQVGTRQLSSTIPSQSKTVSATGQGATQAVKATGTLAFRNFSTTKDQVVKAGTTFNVAGGIQIVTDADIDIPAATPTGTGTGSVSAHAVPAGVSGNISALAINQFCCSSDNTVGASNPAAFSGGKDAVTYPFVQQSDIDGAANPLKTSLTQQAQAQLQSQVHTGEQFVNPPQCIPMVTSDQQAGDPGQPPGVANVMVTVSVSCKGQVYDQSGALSIGGDALRKETTTKLGAVFAPVGSIVTKVTGVTPLDQGRVAINVAAEGIWVHQFDQTTLQRLPGQLAGKTKDAATKILMDAGAAKVDIQLTGGDGKTLPTDATQIKIKVVQVSGLMPTPTATPKGTLPPATPAQGK